MATDAVANQSAAILELGLRASTKPATPSANEKASYARQ